jgi:hypothetical protein
VVQGPASFPLSRLLFHTSPLPPPLFSFSTPSSTPASTPSSPTQPPPSPPPDKNQDDPLANQRFQELGQAYQVLSSAELRRKYDSHGSQGLDVNFVDAADFFTALFGSDRFERLVGGGLVGAGMQRTRCTPFAASIFCGLETMEGSGPCLAMSLQRAPMVAHPLCARPPHPTPPHPTPHHTTSPFRPPAQVGELVLAAAARLGRDATPETIRRLQGAREEGLVQGLKEMLQPWVEGEEELFKVSRAPQGHDAAWVCYAPGVLVL